MAVHLSGRMEALLELVSPCPCIADVGCDHAYLSIALIQRQVVQRAIAMDINEGPLGRAKEHIHMCGLEDRIELRLSDGLENYQSKESQAILIAGMGGDLIRQILSQGEQAARAAEQIILGAQSELGMLRVWLWREGYHFLAEDLLKEDGKWYFLMKISAQEGQVGAEQEALSQVDEKEKEHLNPVELTYGPLLLKEKHPLLSDYLAEEEQQFENILEKLPHDKRRRRTELEQSLQINRQAQFLLRSF